MSAERKIVKPIDNDITVIGRSYGWEDVAGTLFGRIAQLDPKTKLELILRLYENDFIKNPPEDIQKLIVARQEAREKEKVERQRKQDEIRKVQSTPDFKFPLLFRQNRLECMDYIKTLDTKSLTKLRDDIKTRPHHWDSLVSYEVVNAVQMLEAELQRR